VTHNGYPDRSGPKKNPFGAGTNECAPAERQSQGLRRVATTSVRGAPMMQPAGLQCHR
jgi:hypothetical protein